MFDDRRQRRRPDPPPPPTNPLGWAGWILSGVGMLLFLWAFWEAISGGPFGGGGPGDLPGGFGGDVVVIEGQGFARRGGFPVKRAFAGAVLFGVGQLLAHWGGHRTGDRRDEPPPPKTSRHVPPPAPPPQVVKVRCGYCGSLNDERDEKCGECGGKL